jgi:hypothetical protein
MLSFIKIFSLFFVVTSFVVPNTSFALFGDIHQNATSTSSCFRFKNNLSYGANDKKTNKEVSGLQEFLKAERLFEGEVTGTFGNITRNAVIAFQKREITDINEKDLDVNLIQDSSYRHTLTTTGFRLNTSGYVGAYTRAKIAYLSCQKSVDVGSVIDTIVSTTSLFTYTTDIQGLPLYVNFGIEKDTKICSQNHGYSIDFGDGQQGDVYGNLFATTNTLNKTTGNSEEQPCSGYFATHTYKQEGEYVAKLIKTTYNTCQGSSTKICPLWVSKSETVGELAVILKSASTTATIGCNASSALGVASSSQGDICGKGSSQEVVLATSSIPLLPSHLTPTVLGDFASNVFCVNLTENMYKGVELDSVVKLQNFLLQKGFLTTTPTGFYGDKTVTAVKDYQTSKGLPVTGMVYDFTRQAIQAETCK